MDRFAGSEPRLFISFRLDNEKLGQTISGQTESMDVTTPNPAIIDYCSSSTSSLSETSGLPVLAPLTIDKEVEADLVPEGPPDLTQLAEEMRTSEQSTEVPPNSAQKTVTATVASLVTYARSSTSEESCGAYFDRKVAIIEEAQSSEAVAANAGSEPKESASEAILVDTTLQESPKHHTESGSNSDSSMEIESARPASPQSPSPTLGFRFSPPVQLFKAPCKPTHYSTGHRGYKPKNPDSKVTIANTVIVQQAIGDQVVEPATGSIQAQTPLRTAKPTRTSFEPRNPSSDAEEGPGSGVNTEIYARSTMEEALTSPKKLPRGHLGDMSSDTSRSSSPVRESGTGPLTSSSRALIKQHFSEASPVFLPRGHPTVAFNEGQVSSILTAVANESARASFDMLSSVVERASRLNLGGCSRCNQPRGPAPKDSLLLTTDSDPDCSRRGFSGSRTSFASDFSQSDGAAGSSTMTPGSLRPSLTSVTHIPSLPAFGCSQEDTRGNTPLTACDSPGGQTLAALKQEAIKDKQVTQVSKRSATRSKIPRRKPIRGGRIMREEYFEGMSWTRVFVSGPLDPEHNPYKFYCLICKDNVSIYTKGPGKSFDTTHLNVISGKTRGGGMSTCQSKILSPEMLNIGSAARMGNC